MKFFINVNVQKIVEVSEEKMEKNGYYCDLSDRLQLVKEVLEEQNEEHLVSVQNLHLDEDSERYVDNVQFIQFIQDCDDCGLEWQHYEGRYGYSGPGCVVGDRYVLEDATDIPLQWDSMGLDYIGYPKR
jgi:hypothetical protein